VIQALILDFGEVLVRPQSAASLTGLAQLAGLDVAEFQRRYWRHRRRYDSGELSAGGYWALVLDAPIKTDLVARLADADARSWTSYREDMWTLAADFRAGGGRTALLSNGVPEVMARVRAERILSRCFDVVLVSYEAGCTKPDSRIYELCLHRLGVPASAALFVDDRRENVAAAERLGIQTLLFTGDADVDEVRRRIASVRQL
jgi:putative hydrolase of the HAD superfamily